MDTVRIIKEHCEKLFAEKLDNRDEMDQFLERHNLPKLIQEETDDLNRPVKEMGSILNNLPKQRHQAQRGLLVNSTKHLGKNYTNSLQFSLEDRSRGTTSYLTL